MIIITFGTSVISHNSIIFGACIGIRCRDRVIVT